VRPLAYFISWTTHGSWIPGDPRGWVERGKAGIQDHNASRLRGSRERMTEPPITLSLDQRSLVEQTIRDHCAIRSWQLHAVNARTNHVHVVVTADRDPEVVMDQFKAWCSRRLNEQAGASRRWWTKHGSTKWINDEEYLQNAIEYVLERQ